MPKCSNNAYSSYNPALFGVIQEVLYRIGDIDSRHVDELSKVDASSTDEELKGHIKQRILAAHQKRRQPYVDLLTTLRLKQQG